MRKMTKITCLMILAVFSSSASATEVSSWLDEKGVVNYTDDHNNVPSKYCNRVETRIMEDIQKPVTTASSQTSVPEGKEIRIDISGRDVTWWKEKVALLRKNLNEAAANYESQRNKFMDKTTEFSGNFGSRTQYKMNVRELNRITAEMDKHEIRMVESKEKLERLFREAEESKANPDWLK